MSHTLSRLAKRKRSNPVARAVASHRPRGKVIPSARVYSRKVKHHAKWKYN